MKLGCADSHRKKSRGNKNTHAVQFLCQWLAGLGVFLRSIPATGILTLCWTRRLAAEPLSVLDERRAGTAIAMCFFKKKTQNPFSFPPSVYSLCCHVLFPPFSAIKAFHLFVILLIHSIVSHLHLWSPFFFQKPYLKHSALIHCIAVCSCCLGNFPSKLP